MTSYGYSRVSTLDQSHLRQVEALKQYCPEDCVFQESASGAKDDRPILGKVLSYIKPGDRLVVLSLDRLGRSLSGLISTIKWLDDIGAEFYCVNNPEMNNKSSSGRLIVGMMSVLADYEYNLIRERVVSGMKVARQEGRHLGRPNKLTAKQWELLYNQYLEGKYSVRELCSWHGISRSTFYSYKHAQESNSDICSD